MPSKKEYDRVSDDGYDNRIPLHNEDAFQHGIHFQAKYIGTLDVPRPSSRVEIVAAMRRIRYEFKAKAVKKRKVDLTVSVDGVKVSICKKKKRLPQWYDENKLLIVHHPIYRIFYVSHDSQDLKIWSYIARDGPTNVFKCNVFKSYKKEQAMRIVRTIGQAFEVCHKLSVAQTVPSPEEPVEKTSNQSTRRENSSKMNDMDELVCASKIDSSTSPIKERATPPHQLAIKQGQQLCLKRTGSADYLCGTTITSPLNSPTLLEDDVIDPHRPISSKHQMQLLRQQVEHHQQQTQVAVAQVQLLKEQLAAETAARIESQARTHQLLLQNRDLLDHMKQILGRLQALEVHASVTYEGQKMLTQACSMPDATTPQCGPVFLPKSLMASPEDGRLTGQDILEDIKPAFDTDSPDSGHREMSSDSLSLCMQQGEHPFWTLSSEDAMKYSFGFGSPLRYKHMTYEMTAVVNSNPFANSREDICDQDIFDFSNCEMQQSSSGDQNKSVEKIPKLQPPPEFRNFDSLNHSHSDDSSNSSNSDTDSVKDGIVNFTDSDYYSHTGSSFNQNNAYLLEQTEAHYMDSNNRGLKKSNIVKPKLEPHYNNFASDEALFRKYFDSTDGGRSRRSSSDEDNTESYDEHLAQPPYPPPPPNRLEEMFDD